MQTLRLPVNADDLEGSETKTSLETAAQLLRSGELVAFPTETVYGLGCDAMQEDAVARVFAAKGRPAWDPVIVHIANVEGLRRVIASLAANVEERVRALTQAFWPGPLTLLLPRAAQVPPAVTAGGPLVGVRWPAHRVAQQLILRAGVPIAAPSANRFGHVSPTSAEHVFHDLDGRIAAVLDGGPSDIGVESSVLDITAERPVLYRPGDISRSQLERVLHCEITLRSDAQREGNALPSPGVGIRHYAPAVPVVLAANIEELRTAAAGRGRRGVMLPDGWESSLHPADVTFPWGPWNNPAVLAQRLYAGLRDLEDAGIAVIVVPLPEDETLQDRLRKAAR